MAIVLWIFYFWLCAFSTNNANVISFDKFKRKQLVDNNKIWNTYLYKSSAELLIRTVGLKWRVLPDLLRYYRKLSQWYNLETIQRGEMCASGKPYSFYVTGVVGRVCDYLTKEKPTTRRLHITESIKQECLNSQHFLLVRGQQLAFSPHKDIFINLTLIRMDLELSYHCNIEYVAQGHTFEMLQQAENKICGKMPQITYITMSQLLRIVVLSDKKPGRVEFQFQITDPYFIAPSCCERCLQIADSMCYNFANFEEKTTKGKAYIYFMFGVKILNLDTEHHVYSIHIRKIVKLKLRLRNYNKLSRFYDGPYVLHEFLVIPDKSAIYLFSSFQATQVYSFDKILTHVIDVKHQIGADRSKCTCLLVNHQTYVFLSEENHLTVNKNCIGDCDCRRQKTTKHCVLDIQAHSTRHTHVNVSFNSIRYEGPNIDNCR